MASVRLRCFAGAREAAGTGSADFYATTLGDLLAQASERFGEQFRLVLETSRVWVNGEEPGQGEARGRAEETELQDGDEIAILPPVSGG